MRSTSRGLPAHPIGNLARVLGSLRLEPTAHRRAPLSVMEGLSVSAFEKKSRPGRRWRFRHLIAVPTLLMLLAVPGISLTAAVTHTAPPSAPPYTLEALSGSYAPYGENRYLIIDSLGRVSYYRRVIDSVGVDSIFTILSPEARDALYDTVFATSFLALASQYDSGIMDGSGVVVRFSSGATDHTVEARNMAVSSLNRLVRAVNAVLAPSGIALSYGTIND